MKIRTRVWGLCLSSAALLIALGLFGVYQINQLAQTVNRGAEEEGKSHFQVLLTTERRSIESYITDLTWWDDMVEFTETQNPDFGDENIKESLQTYGLDAGAVFTPDFNLFYSADTRGVSSLGTFNRQLKMLIDGFKSAHQIHFFASSPEGIIELFGGAIYPSDDSDRKSEPRGYFVVARPWDDAQVKIIETISQCDVALERPFREYKDPSSALDNCHFRIPLMSIHGNPIGMLNINQNIPYIRRHQELSKKYLSLFICLSALLGVILLAGMYRWVLYPLKRISRCLQDNTTEPLLKLTRYSELSEMKTAIELRLNQSIELKIAKEEAEKANLSKSQFLRNLSHEFKTPLNGVFGAQQMLETTELTDEQLEYTKIINDCGENLNQLINELLALTQLENATFELDEHPFSPHTLFQELAHFSQQKAEGTGICFVYAPAKMPSVLLGDESCAHKIIQQLLRNAFKFTQTGEIALQIESIEEAKTLILRISVSDTGIGVPDDKKAQIMHNFTQADESDSRQYAGLGIGLALASAMTVKMHGQISFTSEEGLGSTFTVELPFRKVTA